MGKLFGAGYLNIFITCVILCNLKGHCSVAFQIPPDSKLNKRISCKAVKTLHTAFRLNTVTKPWCGTHTLLMNEKHLIH